MQGVLHLQPDVVEHLTNQLEHTKIANTFIFSIFSSQNKNSKSSMQIKKEELVTEVFEVLYTFCLSKATLKSIAKELCTGVDALFVELDEHNQHQIDRTDLKLILGSSNIKVKESDVSILMNHFGDGDVITLESMKDVISIQKSN